MITSVTNQKIKQIIQWQKKSKERRKDDVFLVEGFKMCREAPEDWVLEIYLSQGAQTRARENRGLWERLQKCGYELVSDEVFSRMSDTRTPQGILAVLRQPHYRLEELLEQAPALLVLLENLQDPGNVGTIVRTGEGAGITGVIMNSGTVDLFNPKTIRSTMGSIYRIPCLYVEDLGRIVEQLHAKGIHTYAAHLKGRDYYSSFSFREPAAFLIGNEGNGLSDTLADKAESYLKIPMEGQVESLNAAIAAALLMYEAHRQRV